MRRVMLASLVGSAVALVAVAGYAAADVLDVAPGILTLDRPVAAPTPTVSGTPAPVLLPEPAATVDPLLTDTGAAAPAPTRAGLRQALTTASDDPALRKGTGISVRDGITGEELWALGAATPRVPASTQKLLAALAVADGLDLTDRMTTSVVALPASADVVLVVGGDTLLAPGAGDPEAVAGRAGLADLAAQVAASLAPSGRTSVRLRLDLTHAPGPRYPSTWNPHDVRDGFTQAVVMTGLATQLPRALHPSPLRPEKEVADALVDRLADRGITATLRPERTWSAAAPAGRPGARQRRVGDLRRGARLRDRPQRERPHREPHPTGRRGLGPVDDPPGRQREVHPRAAGRPRRADGRAGHHRRLRAQPRAEGRRRHPVGGARPGCHRRGRRAARGGRRAFRCRGCRAR